MANYWFQCKNCNTLIQKDKAPTTSGCSQASFHSWQKLGEVGSINYQCKKCGILVQCKATPTTLGCTAASFHSWQKL